LKLRIDQIQVGERRREDMGDVQGLADSIAKYGLLHPVVVDDQNRLVAGGRRLAACKLLGWQEVEVRSLGELTVNELRTVELEENLRRKDLTEYEKSKDMVELVQVVKEQIKDEIVCADSAQAPTNKKGVTVHGSYRDIANRTGFPESTIRAAEKHVAAVEKYPELKAFTKDNAIKVAGKLDVLPPEVREQKLEQFRENREHAQQQYKEDETLINRKYRVKKEFHNAIYNAALLQLNPENIDAWLEDLPRDFVESDLPTIRTGIEKLTELEKILKSRLSGPRMTAIKGGLR